MKASVNAFLRRKSMMTKLATPTGCPGRHPRPGEPIRLLSISRSPWDGDGDFLLGIACLRGLHQVPQLITLPDLTVLAQSVTQIGINRGGSVVDKSRNIWRKLGGLGTLQLHLVIETNFWVLQVLTPPLLDDLASGPRTAARASLAFALFGVASYIPSSHSSPTPPF